MEDGERHVEVVQSRDRAAGGVLHGEEHAFCAPVHLPLELDERSVDRVAGDRRDDLHLSAGSCVRDEGRYEFALRENFGFRIDAVHRGHFPGERVRRRLAELDAADAVLDVVALVDERARSLDDDALNGIAVRVLQGRLALSVPDGDAVARHIGVCGSGPGEARESEEAVRERNRRLRRVRGEQRRVIEGKSGGLPAVPRAVSVSVEESEEPVVAADRVRAVPADETVDLERIGVALDRVVDREALADKAGGAKQEAGLAFEVELGVSLVHELENLLVELGRRVLLRVLLGVLVPDFDRRIADVPVVERDGGEHDALDGVGAADAEDALLADDRAVHGVAAVGLAAHVDAARGVAVEVGALAALRVGQDRRAHARVRLGGEAAGVEERDVDLRHREGRGVSRVGAAKILLVVGPPVVVKVRVGVVVVGVGSVGDLPLGRHHVAVVVALAPGELARGGLAVVVHAAVARGVHLVDVGSGAGFLEGVEAVAIDVAVSAAADRGGGGLGLLGLGGAADPPERDDVLVGARDVGAGGRIDPGEAREVPESVREHDLGLDGVPPGDRRVVERDAHGLAEVELLVSVDVHPAEEAVGALDHVGVRAERVADEVGEAFGEGVALDAVVHHGAASVVDAVHVEAPGLQLHEEPSVVVGGELAEGLVGDGHRELAGLVALGGRDLDGDRGRLDEPVLELRGAEGALQADVAVLAEGHDAVDAQVRLLAVVDAHGVAAVEGSAHGVARGLLAVGVDAEAGQLGLLAVVVVGDVELRMRVVAGVGRVGLGHELGPIGPAVVVRIDVRVEAVGAEAVGDLPGVVHAVAIVVELAVGEAGAVGAGEVVAVAVSVGVGRVRVGAGEIFGVVVEAVAVGVAVGAVRAGGVVRIEAVGDLPPVGQAVAVGVDGGEVPAGPLVVPHRDVDVGHRVEQREHVGEDRNVLVLAPAVEMAAEVAGVALVPDGDAGVVGLAVGVHRVADLLQLDGRVLGTHRVRLDRVGALDHRIEVLVHVLHPVGGGAEAVAVELVVGVVERNELTHVLRRALGHVGHGVLDVGHVAVVRAVDGGAVVRRVPPRGGEVARSEDAGIGGLLDAGESAGATGAVGDEVPSLRILVGVVGREERVVALDGRAGDVRQVVEGIVVEKLLREVAEARGPGQIDVVPEEALLVDRLDVGLLEALPHAVVDLALGAAAVPDADFVDPALVELRLVEHRLLEGVARAVDVVAGDDAPAVRVVGADDDRGGAVVVVEDVVGVGAVVLAVVDVVEPEQDAGAGLEGGGRRRGNLAVEVHREGVADGVHRHGDVVPDVGHDAAAADRDGGLGRLLDGVVVDAGDEVALRIDLDAEGVARGPRVGAGALVHGHEDRTVDQGLRTVAHGLLRAEPELDRKGRERVLVVEERLAGAARGVAVEVHRLAGDRAVEVERVGGAVAVGVRELVAVGEVVVVGVVALVDLEVEEVGRRVAGHADERLVPPPVGGEARRAVIEVHVGVRVARVGEPVGRRVGVVEDVVGEVARRLLLVGEAVLVRVGDAVAGEPRAENGVKVAPLHLRRAKQVREAGGLDEGDGAEADHRLVHVADVGGIPAHAPVVLGAVADVAVLADIHVQDGRAAVGAVGVDVVGVGALHSLVEAVDDHRRETAAAVGRVETVVELPVVGHAVGVGVGHARAGARESGGAEVVVGDVGPFRRGIAGSGIAGAVPSERAAAAVEGSAAVHAVMAPVPDVHVEVHEHVGLVDRDVAVGVHVLRDVHAALPGDHHDVEAVSVQDRLAALLDADVGPPAAPLGVTHVFGDSVAGFQLFEQVGRDEHRREVRLGPEEVSGAVVDEADRVVIEAGKRTPEHGVVRSIPPVVAPAVLGTGEVFLVVRQTVAVGIAVRAEDGVRVVRVVVAHHELPAVGKPVAVGVGRGRVEVGEADLVAVVVVALLVFRAVGDAVAVGVVAARVGRKGLVGPVGIEAREGVADAHGAGGHLELDVRVALVGDGLVVEFRPEADAVLVLELQLHRVAAVGVHGEVRQRPHRLVRIGRLGIDRVGVREPDRIAADVGLPAVGKSVVVRVVVERVGRAVVPHAGIDGAREAHRDEVAGVEEFLAVGVFRAARAGLAGDEASVGPAVPQIGEETGVAPFVFEAELDAAFGAVVPAVFLDEPVAVAEGPGGHPVVVGVVVRTGLERGAVAGVERQEAHHDLPAVGHAVAVGVPVERVGAEVVFLEDGEAVVVDVEVRLPADIGHRALGAGVDGQRAVVVGDRVVAVPGVGEFVGVLGLADAARGARGVEEGHQVLAREEAVLVHGGDLQDRGRVAPVEPALVGGSLREEVRIVRLLQQEVRDAGNVVVAGEEIDPAVRRMGHQVGADVVEDRVAAGIHRAEQVEELEPVRIVHADRHVGVDDRRVGDGAVVGEDVPRIVRLGLGDGLEVADLGLEERQARIGVGRIVAARGGVEGERGVVGAPALGMDVVLEREPEVVLPAVVAAVVVGVGAGRVGDGRRAAGVLRRVRVGVVAPEVAPAFVDGEVARVGVDAAFGHAAELHEVGERHKALAARIAVLGELRVVGGGDGREPVRRDILPRDGRVGADADGAVERIVEDLDEAAVHLVGDDGGGVGRQMVVVGIAVRGVARVLDGFVFVGRLFVGRGGEAFLEDRVHVYLAEVAGFPDVGKAVLVDVAEGVGVDDDVVTFAVDADDDVVALPGEGADVVDGRDAGIGGVAGELGDRVPARLEARGVSAGDLVGDEPAERIDAVGEDDVGHEGLLRPERVAGRDPGRPLGRLEGEPARAGDAGERLLELSGRVELDDDAGFDDDGKGGDGGRAVLVRYGERAGIFALARVRVRGLPALHDGRAIAEVPLVDELRIVDRAVVLGYARVDTRFVGRAGEFRRIVRIGRRDDGGHVIDADEERADNSAVPARDGDGAARRAVQRGDAERKALAARENGRLGGRDGDQVGAARDVEDRRGGDRHEEARGHVREGAFVDGDGSGRDCGSVHLPLEGVLAGRDGDVDRDVVAGRVVALLEDADDLGRAVRRDGDRRDGPAGIRGRGERLDGRRHGDGVSLDPAVDVLLRAQVGVADADDSLRPLLHRDVEGRDHRERGGVHRLQRGPGRKGQDERQDGGGEEAEEGLDLFHGVSPWRAAEAAKGKRVVRGSFGKGLSFVGRRLGVGLFGIRRRVGRRRAGKTDSLRRGTRGGTGTALGALFGRIRPPLAHAPAHGLDDLHVEVLLLREGGLARGLRLRELGLQRLVREKDLLQLVGGRDKLSVQLEDLLRELAGLLVLLENLGAADLRLAFEGLRLLRLRVAEGRNRGHPAGVLLLLGGVGETLLDPRTFRAGRGRDRWYGGCRGGRVGRLGRSGRGIFRVRRPCEERRENCGGQMDGGFLLHCN